MCWIDVAVAPVLVTQEFHDVVAVLSLLLAHDADEAFGMACPSRIDVGDRIPPRAEILGIHALEGLVAGGVVGPETELPWQVHGDAGHVVLFAVWSIGHDAWDLLFVCVGGAVDVGVELGAVSHDDFNVVVADDVALELLAVLVVPLLFAGSFFEQVLSSWVEAFVTVVTDGGLADWLEGNWDRVSALPIYTCFRKRAHC